MRSLSRNGHGHWPMGALVATGLGLGAVGGFLGSLARQHRDTRAALDSAQHLTAGQLPAPRAVRDDEVLRALDRPRGTRF